ncbi:DUF4214 domain-containing protein [Poseidonibacter lekithochrous]|uniref:DUF4214 domain-containing protein n=1 Tax=Poseidonibacter TaxID=2321187 RepID=UPI001C09AD30|nr:MULTISPECIES: DUF4214 domain-containing protein [Poseidonibacter]MBU3013611.1 DUF4214 domain-containing protein [Poseidonibacter lekithochrous]MDO6826908.1 DUF4214 domain-containing protein [Poseidonibacter sp. 1_MG-2023]
MAFSENQSSIAELYIAALGRSPEKSGLDYWVSELEAGRKTLIEIQDNFFDTNISEVAARFPVGTTSTQFVESVYVNVFGRASDEGGLNYWANRLDLPASDENHLSTSTLMTTMLSIAKDPANSIDGAVLADNLSDAQTSYENSLISVENGFIEEWINGKTLYGAFDWGLDGWTYAETSFENGIVSFAQTIDGNFSENYTLTSNGGIYVTNNEGSFIWSIEEITNDYIRVTPQAAEKDYLFFEPEGAYDLVENNGILELVDSIIL